MEESRKFGDILIMDVIDNFHNESTKMYGYLNFAEIFYWNTKCVTKVNSNTIIDVRALEEFCIENSGNFLVHFKKCKL